MSARGGCYDNVVARRYELVHHCNFAVRQAARVAIFDYIEVSSDCQPLHQTLGYVSPIALEQQRSSV